MPFEFDLALAEQHIKLRNEDGILVHYVMREATGVGRDAYFNHLTKTVDVDLETGKAKGVKEFGGVQAMLLHHCLYEKLPPKGLKQVEVEKAEWEDGNGSGVRFWDEKKEPPSIKNIGNWPSRVQDGLFDEAMKISKLDKETQQDDKDAAKND